MIEFEPKIYRTIIFVRHGQYSSVPEKLTALGRKQAQLTAKALALLQPSKIHCSTMPRAVETAEIIGKHAGLKINTSDKLREGYLPGTTAFNKLITKGKLASEKEAILTGARSLNCPTDSK